MLRRAFCFATYDRARGAFNGEFLAISAEVKYIHENEPVSLIYSTADRQIVDQLIPMTCASGEYRHQCRFPPDSLGLQQDYEYRLAAGDARTRPFKIRVRTAPAIVVDRVDYHYPAYTRMADQSVDQQGDLRRSKARKRPCTPRPTPTSSRRVRRIDLGCTGHGGVEMTATGHSAVGHFVLRLSHDDLSRPEHESYQLRFADVQGQENRRPIRHRIEVIRDLPPDIQILEPPKAEAPVAVAVDGRLPIRLPRRRSGLRAATRAPMGGIGREAAARAIAAG